MKIGIAGPVATEDVVKHLGGNIASLPQGHTGSPAMGTLIAALIERGHQVSAYTLDATAPSLRQTLVAAGPSFKLYVVPYRPRSMRFNGKRLGRILDFFKEERDALQKAMVIDKPEVVSAHWTYEYALAAIASGIPHVITCHDAPAQVLRFMPNLYRLGRYLMAREVFKNGKRFTAVSDYLKNELQSYTKIPIEVIPNVAPTDFFKGPLIVHKPELDPDRPRVAMVLNGWQARKNPEPALRAFSLFRRRVPGATLHLFGYDFGKGEKAQIWAEREKISEGMVFCGSIAHDRLLAELNNMHLLLHPALEESLGMCLVEAMGLGLPVIGGDKSGAVPWVLEHGKAGILIDVRCAETIVQALVGIVKDKTRYIELSRAGQERVRRIFSPAAVADAYEKIYALAITEASGTVLNA